MGSLSDYIFNLLLRLLKAIPGWLFLIVCVYRCPTFSEEKPNLETYRNECIKGVTIYCLSAGMKEQKAGSLDQALEYYRLACESHSTEGHLRACTPFFSLARQLGRLEQATKNIEIRCQEGNEAICFYLAKAYFKIGEYIKGQKHLERLCQVGFSPHSDRDNYGSCYHLGKSYQKTNNLKRAKKIFQFDCKRNNSVKNPNCNLHEALKIKMGMQERFKWEFRKWESVDFLLAFLVLIPLMSWIFYQKGEPRTLSKLRYLAPVLALFCSVIWAVENFKPIGLRMELIFIIHSDFLVALIGWLAHEKLKTKNVE